MKYGKNINTLKWGKLKRQFKMNKPNLNWFYLHIALVLIVLVKDYNGRLEVNLVL